MTEDAKSEAFCPNLFALVETRRLVCIQNILWLLVLSKVERKPFGVEVFRRYSSYVRLFAHTTSTFSENFVFRLCEWHQRQKVQILRVFTPSRKAVMLISIIWLVCCQISGSTGVGIWNLIQSMLRTFYDEHLKLSVEFSERISFAAEWKASRDYYCHVRAIMEIIDRFSQQ